MATPAEHAVTAPFAGVVVAIPHACEEHVDTGNALVVLEAMKMEHEVLAEIDGVVRALAVAVGDAVQEGQLLLTLASSPEGEPGTAAGADTTGGRHALRSNGRAASARTCAQCASATRSAWTRRDRRR